MFKVIKSQDDRNRLQVDLQDASIWADKWKMVFNLDKCKTMSISRKKLTADATTDVTYTMKGSALDYVRTIEDLGIIVSNDLNWHLHISNITSKANKVLGLIKRVCKDLKDPDTRKILYCSLVLPQLEYCSQLWSPIQVNQKLLLENVQRRATKFILNYPKDMTYKERLLKLKLLPLEYRSDISDLIFFHKCVIGQYHLNLDTLVQRKPESDYLIRSHDPNNFVEFKCRTKYFYHSYFPRVVRAWNSLPREIKEIDTNLAFKRSIRAHFRTKFDSYELPNCA
jgi:hypothetical protein